MKHNSLKLLYVETITVGLLLSLVVLSQALIYPLAHYGYNYYGIAYNMWVNDSFWYPSWHHVINIQKPPLYYWLTQICWWLFGIHQIFMPLIILIFYVFTAIYSAKTCLIFSANMTAARITSILVLMNIIFLNYINLIRFDIQLTFSFILAFYALSKILQENRFNYWWLYLFATVMGIFFKGPVIFLFTLPAAIFGLLLLQPHFLTKTQYLFYTAVFTLLSVPLVSIWLIPANYHSHGIYFHETVTQTLQRFNHTQPDPYEPTVTVSHYHWWSIIARCAAYLATVFIVPFLLILPIFICRIFLGIKNIYKQRINIYFLLTILSSILIFSVGIGLVRYRYVLPLIPLVCILLGILIDTPIDTTLQQLEQRIYRNYLLLLLAIAIILVTCSLLLPALQTNLLLLLQLAIALLLIALCGWHATDWWNRWQRFIVSMLLFTGLFLISNVCYFHSYPTINMSSKKLQQLSAQHQYIVEINHYTREGWPQFLAQNMNITTLPLEKFKLLPHKKNIWIIYPAPLKQLPKQVKNFYPLQFSLQQKNSVPILMPYEVYLQLRRFSFIPSHRLRERVRVTS